MAGPQSLLVRRALTESRDVLDQALSDPEFEASIVAIAAAWTRALRTGNKILICGNGGSAADAQHIAGELLSRFYFDRAPLAGMALTVDTSVLTAIGNDYGYEHSFSRQVRGLGRAGDVLLGISTSGRSPNVLAALEAARVIDMVTVGFTGIGGNAMAPHCDHVLHAPSSSTPLIQQVHITAAHIVCQIVEAEMFPEGAAR
jgi:D-sedoheptulose 7-phosphate isomerase